MIFEPQVINVTVSEEDAVSVTADVVVTHVEADYYDGEYVIIPKAHCETVLPTKEKYMSEDVTVREIPYYETHNETGETVYIAREV